MSMLEGAIELGELRSSQPVAPSFTTSITTTPAWSRACAVGVVWTPRETGEAVRLRPSSPLDGRAL